MTFFGYLYWDPKADLFSLPFFNIPILWYGFFFAAGFWIGSLFLTHILTEYFQKTAHYFPLKARQITDQFSLYIVVGTIVGARLGHLLFYEDPFFLLQDPLEIFRIRNGGLASHGAVFALLIAVYLFAKKLKKEEKSLSFLKLLDFLTIPAAFAAFCIRIGNFFNQEILGTRATVPWAIVFGHPADHSAPIPRHPVQLYEAAVYLGLFFLFWSFKKKAFFFFAEGKLVGLFFTLLFTARFFLEFFKIEQSTFFSLGICTMGQLLSIPFILLGLYLYFSEPKKSAVSNQ